MRKLVFDIETKNIFMDVGTNNPADLDISIVGIYDYETQKYETFTQEEFDKMWPYFKKAEMLVTFNGDHFDIPLLNKYYKKAGLGDLTQILSLDLLKEVRQAYGRRMKLDQIAHGTFGINKSGDGLEAVKWWREGKIDEIRKYCTDDVKITKDVFEFAMKNKKLMFKEGPFTKEIKLDTKHWEPTPEIKTQSLF
ncbi:MAG: ATP-dependent RNA helicase, DEAD/DEAH box family [Parcubacteria bacterium C7867-003]|nr:MAG: ATP-dependent RNA helicase, DEAD/DEAH box family [Parcubacteria bacterium C7867-003]